MKLGSISIHDIKSFEKIDEGKYYSSVEDCVRFQLVALDHIYLTTVVPGYFQEVWHLISLISHFPKWSCPVSVGFFHSVTEDAKNSNIFLTQIS